MKQTDNTDEKKSCPSAHTDEQPGDPSETLRGSTDMVLPPGDEVNPNSEPRIRQGRQAGDANSGDLKVLKDDLKNPGQALANRIAISALARKMANPANLQGEAARCRVQIIAEKLDGDENVQKMVKMLQALGVRTVLRETVHDR